VGKQCALAFDKLELISQAARLVGAGSKSVLVATNDQCIKDCLSGAFFVSSALLLKEVTKVPFLNNSAKQAHALCMRGDNEPHALHAAGVRVVLWLQWAKWVTCGSVYCRWRRKQVLTRRLRCS